MLKKTQIIHFCLFSMTVGFALWGIIMFGCFKSAQADVNSVDDNTSSIQKPSRPMIIWWASRWGEYGDHTALRLAMSSGVFSHVMLVGQHEFQKSDYYCEDNFRKALNICRENGVKVIWTRFLYPGRICKRFALKDVFDAEYYIEQILNIKQEAEQMGVDLVAFDVEPYAMHSLKSVVKRELSEDEFKMLTEAINTAVKVAGQVDFILPTVTSKPRYLYNCTRVLGKLAISEYTYHDYPPVHTKEYQEKRPFDIMGARVNLTKENEENPKLLFFTPKEILERQDLWKHKKGLFIIASSKETTLAVTREFSRIKFIQPVSDDNNIK